MCKTSREINRIRNPPPTLPPDDDDDDDPMVPMPDDDNDDDDDDDRPTPLLLANIFDMGRPLCSHSIALIGPPLTVQLSVRLLPNSMRIIGRPIWTFNGAKRLRKQNEQNKKLL